MSDTSIGQAEERPLRVGVIGARGQLGSCLVRSLRGSPTAAPGPAFAITRDEIDLSSAATLGAEIDSLLDRSSNQGLDYVINAAAYTKVDQCETERELAYQVNALAPGEWAKRLAERQVGFIHVSTDYVFEGQGNRPYRDDDPTDPRTVYGASKRAGEIAVLGVHPTALVVRTSWVFGPGRNFPAAILEQARKRRSGEAEGALRVVDDQQGSPTYAGDLAEGLLELIRLGRSQPGGASLRGLVHLRNAGETTWFDFARAILDRAGFADVAIDPVPSTAFETAAPRPAYSVLDCSRAAELGIALPDWTDALTRYLAGPDSPLSKEEIAAGDLPR